MGARRVYRVFLPTSSQFRAVRLSDSRRANLEISRLNGAVADGVGNVTLEDGTAIRAVEVLPARLPYEPSELEWAIVHGALSVLKGRRRGYRLLNGLRFLDCSILSNLELPPLKVIASLCRARYPIFKRVSDQKMPFLLLVCG
jgi:hypothetical protein